MLIQAYGAEGAIALSREFPLQFLDDLLCQTVELRRDPEERIKEAEEQEVLEWKEKNKDKEIEFYGLNGDVKRLSLASFPVFPVDDGGLDGFTTGNSDTSQSDN